MLLSKAMYSTIQKYDAENKKHMAKMYNVTLQEFTTQLYSVLVAGS